MEEEEIVPPRYLALLNALGHTSPDSLEDFIYLHGPCIVVPPSALPDASALETQSDPHSPSRASRYASRKAELVSALATITRLEKEIAFEKAERAKSDKGRDRAQELLDGVCDEARDLRAKLAATTDPDEVEWLREKVGVCERVIDEIDRENEVLRKRLGIDPDEDVVVPTLAAREQASDREMADQGQLATSSGSTNAQDQDVAMEDHTTPTEPLAVASRPSAQATSASSATIEPARTTATPPTTSSSTIKSTTSPRLPLPTALPAEPNPSPRAPASPAVTQQQATQAHRDLYYPALLLAFRQQRSKLLKTDTYVRTTLNWCTNIANVPLPLPIPSLAPRPMDDFPAALDPADVDGATYLRLRELREEDAIELERRMQWKADAKKLIADHTRETIQREDGITLEKKRRKVSTGATQPMRRSPRKSSAGPMAPIVPRRSSPRKQPSSPQKAATPTSPERQMSSQVIYATPKKNSKRFNPLFDALAEPVGYLSVSARAARAAKAAQQQVANENVEPVESDEEPDTLEDSPPRFVLGPAPPARKMSSPVAPAPSSGGWSLFPTPRPLSLPPSAQPHQHQLLTSPPPASHRPRLPLPADKPPTASTSKLPAIAPLPLPLPRTSAKGKGKQKEVAVAVKAESSDDAYPPLFAFGLLGPPPSPPANWTRIAQNEQALAAREVANVPTPPRKKKRAREEPLRVEPPVKKRKVLELLEEDDRKEKKAQREREKERKAAERRRERREDKRREKKAEPEPADEDDEERAPYDLDAGPSPGDTDGKRYMRRVHDRRHREVASKKAGRDASGSKPVIEINPAKNGGEAHHFNQVVRNKNERKKLVADTCDGCAAWYERTAGATTVVCKGHGKVPKATTDFLEDRAKALEARVQHASRHRAQHRADPDPPDYWQMGFPGTQRVEKINRQADAIRAEKRAYQEAQADKDGFYRYRQT